MNKILVAVASVALLGWAGSAWAVDDVASTKHNLSSSANSTNNNVSSSEDEICVFCHTPHGGSSTAPLWNRTLGATGDFTQYDSDTMDMDNSGGPGPISLACLSCHDGVTGLGVIINSPGSGLGADITTTPATLPAGIALIGTDLRNDHPVGVIYNNTAGTGGDTAFNDASSLDTTVVKLFGGQVECASCHNPHEATLATFLRSTNAGSAMCLECHIK